MFENRSFDHVLGYLDHPSPRFDGIGVPPPTNPLNPADPSSARVATEKRRRLRLRVDPDHSHGAAMVQLGLAGGAAEPTNDGVVRSYEDTAGGKGPGAAKAKHWARILTGATIVVAAAAAISAFVLPWWVPVALGVVAAVVLFARVHFVPRLPHHPGDGRRIMRCWDPA